MSQVNPNIHSVMLKATQVHRTAKDGGGALHQGFIVCRGKKMNLQFQHFCVGKPLLVYEVSKVCVVSKAKSGQTFLGNSFEGLFQSYD